MSGRNRRDPRALQRGGRPAKDGESENDVSPYRHIVKSRSKTGVRHGIWKGTPATFNEANGSAMPNFLQITTFFLGPLQQSGVGFEVG